MPPVVILPSHTTIAIPRLIGEAEGLPPVSAGCLELRLTNDDFSGACLCEYRLCTMSSIAFFGLDCLSGLHWYCGARMSVCVCVCVCVCVWQIGTN